jgi:hypothetical protein
MNDVAHAPHRRTRSRQNEALYYVMMTHISVHLQAGLNKNVGAAPGAGVAYLSSRPKTKCSCTRNRLSLEWHPASVQAIHNFCEGCTLCVGYDVQSLEHLQRI